MTLLLLSKFGAIKIWLRTISPLSQLFCKENYKKNWSGLNWRTKVLKVVYAWKWRIYLLKNFVKKFTGKLIENSKFYVFFVQSIMCEIKIVLMWFSIFIF